MVQPQSSLGAAAGGRVDALSRVSGSIIPTDVVPTPISDVAADGAKPMPTGLSELDRVLGGGLVQGSVTLLGGEPGVGKSTLVLQYLAAQARAGADCTYVTGEESVHQVASRARRLDALDPRIALLPETSLDRLLESLGTDTPRVCVVDSIQTLHDPASGSSPGSISQVRDCAHQLVAAAKTLGITIVLVGHVTKDGALAGPRVLEHIVDTVLTLDGDRHGELRIIRAVKHRFGSTQEIGLFEITEAGFIPVDDPSELFLADRRPGIPGSVVVPALEGQRPLLVEVQALVTKTQLPHARRSAQGLDGGRLNLLLAVLARRMELPTSGLDVYAMAVGGVKISEPGADLAICAAVTSSITNVAVVERMVLFGEVGLGGELRRVARMEQRLGEAARHGFTAAVVPRSAPVSHPDIQVMAVPSLDAALTVAGVVPDDM
jgi:DNA repair protein RadA/Sms